VDDLFPDFRPMHLFSSHFHDFPRSPLTLNQATRVSTQSAIKQFAAACGRFGSEFSDVFAEDPVNRRRLSLYLCDLRKKRIVLDSILAR